jgi:glycosyltransferase involved in cell wall biosynthesis
VKKILVITDNLPDQINGVVTTYKNLEACAVLDDYSIVYLSPIQFGYVNCPGYPEVKLALPRKMAQAIEAIPADYYHIATEGPVGLWARAYLTRRGIKYNTSYHTRFPEGLHKLLGVPPWLTWRYIRWFHKHSGRCLTTTNTVKQQLELHGLNNVVTWTRGVDREIFFPVAQKHKQLITLLCVSRVSVEKSLEDFCKLDIPNTRKILVGDGPQLGYLQKHYPGVLYTGYKTGHELAEYYQQADVFVFPSRWDTFGIVMLEAMACGTPIAAYPVPGPQDVVNHGVTGYLDQDLTVATLAALQLDRSIVYKNSLDWTWQNCWQIFKHNLVRPL